jgi:phage-related protein
MPSGVHALLELERLGSELRRPLSDALQDGIRELRVRHKRMHYRMLYFFNGKNVAVVSHGCTKEGQMPKAEIAKAIARRKLIQIDPQMHIAMWRM